MAVTRSHAGCWARRQSASREARTRCSATSSANGCWACRKNPRPTRACPSRICSSERSAVDSTRRRASSATAFGSFLSQHCVRRVDSRDTPMLDDRTTAMNFQRRLFDAGLAGLTVPARVRGAGAEPAPCRDLQRRSRRLLPADRPLHDHHRDVRARAARARHRRTDARRHIPNMLAGHEIWCQMFSEPERRQRRRVAADARRARRRRVGDQWAKGVDVDRRTTRRSECASLVPTSTCPSIKASR